MNTTKTNLWLDIALFPVMLVVLFPSLTGLKLHEWISLLLAVPVVIHLVFHRQWFTAALRRFFGQLAKQSRVNLVLNLLLFANIGVIVVTGLLISQEALPLFGIIQKADPTLGWIHHRAGEVSAVILALHIALHWKWIDHAAKRYIPNPFRASIKHNKKGT